LIRTVRGQGYMVPSEASLAIEATVAPLALLPLPLRPQVIAPVSEIH
jgi:hypothetical protein